MWTPTSPLMARLLGDLLRAGDLYYQRGELRAAAEMYARGGQPAQAARIARESGDVDLAVRYLTAANLPGEAGELLAAAGRHREALPLLEQARSWDRAARSCLDLGLTERAAHLFEKAGQLRTSASAFEKAGQPHEALRVLEREARSLEQRVRYSPDEGLARDRKLVDRQRAALLAKLGKPAEAGELLAGMGRHDAAAELFEKAGLFDRAVRELEAADLPQLAFRLLDRATGLSAEERARLYRSGQKPAEAAALYEEAGQPAEAAECWEAAGRWPEAARAWEAMGESARAGDLFYRAELWGDAARCFSTAGRPDLAARAYGQIPDHGSAAASWVAAGRPLQGAQQYLQAGRPEDASRALQGIPPESPDFDRASLLLVPLLVEEGLVEGALHRLELLGQRAGSGTGAMAVERFYWEGRAREALGQAAAARAAYEKAAALKRDFRDVSQRLRQLAEASDTGRDATNDTAPVSVAVVERAAGAKPGTEPLAVGDVLARRYEVRRELGRGGMGRVYEVWDRELGDTVALKTLLSRSAGEVDADRLLREVQICRRITHPNVVRVYDLGRFEGGIFVTMEVLEGETLDRRLKTRGPLPLPEIKEILLQTLAGLREAHHVKIVHRDLKPSNIFLSEPRLKILDFGIARMEEANVDLTLPGEVLGSPKYMSPEQIQGESLDGRSDLYSLGVLTYAMIAGREPYTGKTPSAIALRHLREEPPDILAFRPDLPPAWQTLLATLLKKDRAERYPTAEAAQEAVAGLP